MTKTIIFFLPLFSVFVLPGCGEDKQSIFHVNLPLDTFGDIRQIELVQLPGRAFLMGGGEDNARPVHAVSISPFLIGVTEITQEQYKYVTGSNPSSFRSDENRPVEQVTWYEAADFCNMLSELMGYGKCYDEEYNLDKSAGGFRLPTEAEWEYAAREKFSLGNAAWYVDNSERHTWPVGWKEPNGFGLHDMIGNVSEWTNDFYWYYNCNAQFDPAGPENGVYKVARGCSWADVAGDCNPSTRRPYLPDKRFVLVGFRIARNL